MMPVSIDFGTCCTVSTPALAQQRNGNHLPLVHRTGEGRAPQRLHALGMGDGGGKPPRDVVGDVLAADRHHVRHDQMIVLEDGEARRGAAHVDDGDAQRLLVLRQHGARGRIRRHHEARDREMRALHRQRQVLEVRRLHRDDGEVERQCLAEHAVRILDATRIIEVILQGRQMQDVAAAGVDLGQRRVQHLVHVARLHLARRQGDAAGIDARLRAPARDVDVNVVDGALGHALRCIDGEPDGALGLVHIDDRARAHAARQLVAHAQNLEAVLLLGVGGAVLGRHGFGDEAADLGRADVEGGDEATLGNGGRPDPALALKLHHRHLRKPPKPTSRPCGPVLVDAGRLLLRSAVLLVRRQFRHLDDHPAGEPRSRDLMPRDRSCCDRLSSSAMRSASCQPFSGSCTVMPLSR